MATGSLPTVFAFLDGLWAFWGCMMDTIERYLHFDNIDMSLLLISANCSLCGFEFNEQPRPGEHVDQVLLRIRAKFDAHQCTSTSLLRIQ